MTKQLRKQKLIVVGWSMGAAQAFQWASQYPDMVTHAFPLCGAARTSVHNQVFIDSVRKAIVTDQAFQGGRYAADKPPERGLQAMGRVYAGWGFSQAFYRKRLYTQPPFLFPDLEAFLVQFWEAWATSKDANNVLRHIWTWTHGDIGAQPRYAGASLRDIPSSQGGRLESYGDFAPITKEDDEAFLRALAGIRAHTLVMPCRTDLYFPPEDSEAEVAAMAPGTGEVKVIESIFGHWAGGPGDSQVDAAFIDGAIYDFLVQHSQDVDPPSSSRLIDEA